MSTADSRYPIGPFQFGLPVTTQERTLFLSQVAEAPAKLRAAAAHLNWYVRIKLALTEAEPTIQPFSENLWAELPEARSGAIESSLRIFEGIHGRPVLFFESLAPQDWK